MAFQRFVTVLTNTTTYGLPDSHKELIVELAPDDLILGVERKAGTYSETSGWIKLNVIVERQMDSDEYAKWRDDG